MIRWAALGVLAGLVLLIFTFAQYTLLALIGFLIMLGCSLVIERNVRKLGRAGMQTLTGGWRARGDCAASSATRAAPGATASAATTSTDPAVGYTAAQAAKLAGCTVSQLRYWSRSRARDAGAPTAVYVPRSRRAAGRAVAARRGPVVDPCARGAAPVRDVGHDLASLRIVTDGRDGVGVPRRRADPRRAPRRPARAVRRGRPRRRRRRRRGACVRRRARRVRRAAPAPASRMHTDPMRDHPAGGSGAGRSPSPSGGVG